MTRTSQDNHLPVLNRFARAVWGNSEAVLKQHTGGFQFIDLGPYSAAFESFFAGLGALRHDKILVRNEYRVALQALEKDTYERGAYVVGQPGIGKTLFLVYLLVMRLGQRQAVALQFLDGKNFYALFKGTVKFHQLTNSKPLYQCPFVWALCDSNGFVTIPDSIFLGKQDRVRVIQTTSPRLSRWKWSKQVGGRPYIMDICSDEEVVYLATLLEMDAQRMISLSRNWGNVPRLLVNYIRTEDSTVEARYHQGAGRAVRKCRIMMDGGMNFNFPDDPLSPFYFLRPVGTPTGTIDRELAYVYVPTQTLCCFLAEAFQQEVNLVKLRFYKALSYHPYTRQAAGFIFESWFHSLFIAKRRIDCQWVVQGSGDDVEFPTMSMPADVNLIPATKNAPESATPPYYWIPSKTNFPGINSALVLEDGIFAFQVAMRSEYTPPIDGLKCLQKMLPHNLKNLSWRVVFVGPEEGPIKDVAEYWDGKLFFPTKEDSIPVGWSAVDPAQKGVTYKVPAPKESEELLMPVEVEDEGRAPTPIDE